MAMMRLLHLAAIAAGIGVGVASLCVARILSGEWPA